MAIPPHAKKVFKGVKFDVYHWDQELFDGSRTVFEEVKRASSVDIIALTKHNTVIITKQEQPNREPFISVPGGFCENDDDAITTAKKELLEETGMKASSWELVGEWKSEHRVHITTSVFIAFYCEKVADLNLDSGERIDVLEVSVEEFISMIEKGELHQSRMFREIFYVNMSQESKEKLRKILN